MQNLPPPHWTPTGNSGTWSWDEKGEENLRTGEFRGCWKWEDDGSQTPTEIVEYEGGKRQIIRPLRKANLNWKEKIWKYLSIWRRSWPH